MSRITAKILVFHCCLYKAGTHWFWTGTHTSHTGITITISNKITNLVPHSLYSLIVTIFPFVLSTFLRRFFYLWFLFAITSSRGRDLLFLLFFLLSGKICCWSWVSSQMTFSWRLVQCSIQTILKSTKDRNSICNQLVTSPILEIIERFKITFMACQT